MAWVVQLAEQQIVVLLVVGSNPTPRPNRHFHASSRVDLFVCRCSGVGSCASLIRRRRWFEPTQRHIHNAKVVFLRCGHIAGL